MQGQFGADTDAERLLPARPRPSHPGLRHPPGRRRPTRAAWLWALPAGAGHRTRLGIPAIVHEECLTGLSVWKAATFPTPLAWGAAFDTRAGRPRWVRRSARPCGARHPPGPGPGARRDPRSRAGAGSTSASPKTRTWSAPSAPSYVRGLQSQGVLATLKHFVGYSALAGRAQLRPRARRAARGRRRAADSVRDGHSRRRCPVGDAFLRRDRWRSGGRRSPVADRSPARSVGLRRHGRRGLLRRRVPAGAAPRRGRPRRGRGPGAGGRSRRRAAHR